jgi:hypothetical protein
MAGTGLLASWLAALAALPMALFTAVAGQGIGAMLGGGGWIGISLPWDRQVWALVNQPALNFASLPAAGGYWLGSVAAPLAVALVVIPASLRFHSLTAQLLMVHWAWMSTVVGVLWQPALDPHVSHLTRWLEFRGLPTELRFSTAVLACVAAVPIVLRLLAITRVTRHHLGRGGRLRVVGTHLLPFVAAWAATTVALRGALPVEACWLAGAPVAVVLAVAWIGYPGLLTHKIEPVRNRSFVDLVIAVTLLWSGMFLAGRVLPDGRAAAFQWARDSSFNNIRPWMRPLRAPWMDPTPAAPRSPAS